MNILIIKFLDDYEQNTAIELLRSFRCSELYNIGNIFGKYLLKLFPKSFYICEELGICQYYSNMQYESYNTFKKCLELRGLNNEQSQRVIFNQHFSIGSIIENNIFYNNDIVQNIISNKHTKPGITFTITTCKRLDLFKKTINSFLNCCTDVNKISEWLCIDDNSSLSDREEMKRLYPFFTFYFKTFEEKGHPESMNIIKKKVTTPYICHMEDDWMFYDKRNYISECLEVLNQDSSYGQCLINKNYAEIPEQHNLVGGIFKTTNNGLRYYEHEFFSDTRLFREKYGSGNNCAYWPHFSLRPSLIKKSVLKHVGTFNLVVSHFEMDYSYRYMNLGYKSAFLENIYCKHIGRLTSERNNNELTNAYQLNNETQFGDKDKLSDIKTFVINLERRQDRWECIKK